MDKFELECPNFYKYDDLIKKWTDHYKLPFELVKAQIWQESKFDPKAVSKCGAKGLMQLMPETDYWLDKDFDAFDPEGNIENGCRYDKWLYLHFLEIPDLVERYSFMLAAYNCGRGYINRMIELAYEKEFGEAAPSGHINMKVGSWQFWELANIFLFSVTCKGKRPNANETIDYVEKILKKRSILFSLKGEKDGI